MKRVLSRLKNWIDTDRRDFIRTFLLSEGFGFCLCLSCIWGIRLDMYGGVSGWIIKSILLALLFGDIAADLIMLAWLHVREKENVAEETSSQTGTAVNIKVWLVASAGLLICRIPVWLAYYPAVFAYDAETQLGQVISGVYSTHHPLLHTLLMGGCMKLMWSAGGINAGMALYAFLQMTVMAAICGWLIAEAYRCGVKKIWLFIYGAFLAFFPVNPILAISTTKDVVFSGVLAVCVLLMRRVLSEHDASRKTIIGIIITCALMICFRNNALFAFIPTVVVFALVHFTKKADLKPLMLALIAGCAAGCIINAGLKTALHAGSGSPREALSIPIQQMARVDALYGDKLEPGLRADLEKLLGGNVSDVYDEHLADPVKQQVYMKEPRLFVSTWLKLMTKYPGEYFDAWLYTTEGAWYIADGSCARIYGTGSDTGFGYLSTDVRSMPYGFEVVPGSFLPGLKAALERVVSDNAFEKLSVIRFIFAPALYTWILAACAHIQTVRRDRDGILALILPAAVFLTILMGPAILVRYMYPYMLLVIMPALFFADKKEQFTRL